MPQPNPNQVNRHYLAETITTSAIAAYRTCYRTLRQPPQPQISDRQLCWHFQVEQPPIAHWVEVTWDGELGMVVRVARQADWDDCAVGCWLAMGGDRGTGIRFFWQGRDGLGRLKYRDDERVALALFHAIEDHRNKVYVLFGADSSG